MKGWFSRERETCTPALLAFALGAALLILFQAELSEPSVPAGRSWSGLGDLSRCVGEPVRLTGTVLNVSHYGSVTRIDMLPTLYPIDIVVFPRGKLDLGAGDIIRAVGRVQQYKGRTELVADSIEVR